MLKCDFKSLNFDIVNQMNKIHKFLSPSYDFKSQNCEFGNLLHKVTIRRYKVTNLRNKVRKW